MLFNIRRIGKNKVKLLGRWFFEIGQNFPLPDIALQVAMGEIIADALDRFLVLFDERRRGRAPAQRLNAERAGARVEVKHPRAGYDLRKTGKNHLPDPVLRRAQGVALRRFQVEAAGAAGDDAEWHGKFLDRINKINEILKTG